MQPDSINKPLEDLHEWEEDLVRRYPEPDKPFDQFRDYENTTRASVREFYRLNHQYQCVDFVRQKREQYLPLRTQADGHLGGDGIPEHAGRRQRPRHRSAADRTPDANGRGDSGRRPSALVRAHRAPARLGQGPLPVRRTAMGRRRRHVSGRLCVLGQDRVLRVLRRQSRLPAAAVSDHAGDLHRGLRPGQRVDVLGPRRVPVLRDQGLSARSKRST